MAESSGIQYANEFILDECKLFTVGGLELDLSELVSEVNIYEDIFSNSITGDISFTDTNNVMGNAKIVGQEKLSLRLATPDGSDNYTRLNSIDFTEMPFHVFKIAASAQINDNAQGFTISFTTGELVRNGHIRVSQSFKGEPVEDMIKKVVRGDELLKSKKELFYEPTKNNYKLVAPNMRPFDFINMIARISQSNLYSEAAPYLFYETVKGYYFRTVDGMMDRKNPRMIYRETTPNSLNEKGVQDLVTNLQNIFNYQVVSSTDTLSNSRSGMYASKLLELDFYNKEFNTYEYDYIKDYDKNIHVDEHNKYGSAKSPVLSEAIDDYGFKLSQYPDSVFHMQSIDKSPDNPLMTPMHMEGSEKPYNQMNTEYWLQTRKSRFAQLSSALTLQVEVPGSTAIQAGDLIGLEILNRTKITDEKLDETLTGRYLIRRLHHVFKKGQKQDKHTIHMECIRDTLTTALPSAGAALTDGGSSIEKEIPLGSADPGDVVF